MPNNDMRINPCATVVLQCKCSSHPARSPSLYDGEFRSYLPSRNAPDGGDRPYGRGAHRRSTAFLAQAVERSWLEAADRSKTRHLRSDLGADEDRAGAGTEQ